MLNLKKADLLPCYLLHRLYLRSFLALKTWWQGQHIQNSTTLGLWMHALPPSLVSTGNISASSDPAFRSHIQTGRNIWSAMSDDQCTIWSAGRIKIMGNHQHNLPQSSENRNFHTARCQLLYPVTYEHNCWALSEMEYLLPHHLCHPKVQLNEFWGKLHHPLVL